MGYNLYITRAPQWTDNQAAVISTTEWLELIDSDPSLSRQPNNGEWFADWSPPGASGHAWFDWAEGNVYTKNPDRKTFEKMVQLAAVLGAHVQGEETETYTSPLDLPPRVATQSDSAKPGAKLPAYRTRMIMWNALILGITILAIGAVNLLDLW